MGEVQPLHWPSYANLATAYHQQGDLVRSLGAIQQALELLEPPEGRGVPRPSDRGSLGSILSELEVQKAAVLTALPEDQCKGASCREYAAQALRSAQVLNPSHRTAREMLAHVTADMQSTRASSKQYITDLFDEYAPRFEESLVGELGYAAPIDVRRAVEGVLRGRGVDEVGRLLDAGCGTGLAGMEFRSLARHMVGIDLSENMLRRAEARSIYDELLVGDLETATIASADAAELPFDVIIFTDVLIYFGDLSRVLEVAWDRLCPYKGGLVAFTLELPSEEDLRVLGEGSWRWKLGASGRYSHNPAYVQEAAAAAGYSVVHHSTLEKLRMESGRPVEGSLFVLERTSARVSSISD